MAVVLVSSEFAACKLMFSGYHGWHPLNAARAEADILFSVCFQVCGSFGAGAEKPAPDDAVTGKRLEPEIGFCASKITVNL